MRISVREKGIVRLPDDASLKFDRVTLSDADFSGRQLHGWTAIESRFTRCRFDRTRADSVCWGAGRRVSEYVECSFDGSDLYFFAAGIARFVRCTLRDVHLSNLRATRVECIQCTFSGEVRNGFFDGTIPEEHRRWFGPRHNEFRDNDFSGADLVDFAFRGGIDLERQRLPAGPLYLYLPDAKHAVRSATEAVNAWPDPSRRHLGLTILEVLSFDIERGQQQVLLRADTFDPSVEADVFELLRRVAPNG